MKYLDIEEASKRLGISESRFRMLQSKKLIARTNHRKTQKSGLQAHVWSEKAIDRAKLMIESYNPGDFTTPAELRSRANQKLQADSDARIASIFNNFMGVQRKI